LTLATFEGLEYWPCVLSTANCPDKCRHAGNVAIFTIDKYIVYKKFNELGDDDDGTFAVKLDSGDKTASIINNNIYYSIKALKKGGKVLLSWEHLYITKTEGEVTSEYPERHIKSALPLTEFQAAAIPTVQAPTDSEGLDRYEVVIAQYFASDEDLAVFKITAGRVISLYYNYATLTHTEHILTHTINCKSADSVIVGEIKKLKKDDYVLLAFRRDTDKGFIQTPLFVIPMNITEAKEAMKY